MRTVTMICVLGLLTASLLISRSSVQAAPALQAAQAITVASAAKVKQVALLQGHKQAVFGIAFSPDGKTLASAGIDHSVRLWDVASAKQIAQLDGHTKQAIAVGFSADGATLVSAGYDEAIRLWDVKSAKQTAVEAGDPDNNVLPPQITGVYNAFSPDGQLLVYNMGGNIALELWDVKTKQTHELAVGQAGDSANVYYGPVTFSADGKTLAAAGAAKSDGSNGYLIHEWAVKDIQASDPNNGPVKPSTTFNGPQDAYYGNVIALSRDGALLAVVNTNDNTIHVFDVKAGKVLTTLTIKTPVAGASDSSIYGLAFSADGTLLASGSYDKRVRLWDVKAGKELAALEGHDGVAPVVFSPDGSLLASANLDGTLQLWGAG